MSWRNESRNFLLVRVGKVKRITHNLGKMIIYNARERFLVALLRWSELPGIRSCRLYELAVTKWKRERALLICSADKNPACLNPQRIYLLRL